MYQRVEIPAKNVREIAKLFNYKKRKVNIVATESVTLSGVNWSGGSISIYTPINLVTLQKSDDKAREFGRAAPWDNPYEGMDVALSSGLAMVRTGYFCGQKSTMTIYVHPSNMPALLSSQENV